MKQIGLKIFSYAIFTTLVAASIGLILYLLIDPAKTSIVAKTDDIVETVNRGYFSYLFDAVPDNFIHPFFQGNVIGIALIAITLGISILLLPKENKKVLQNFFSSFFALFLRITQMISSLMPIAIFAFVTLFVKELKEHSIGSGLFYFALCVIGANLIHGVVFLPLLLKYKKISAYKTAKGSFPALLLAFFTKSSSATLPETISSAENRLNVSPKVSRVSLSLCSIINMNACAAFILITVFFVANSHGVSFSLFDMISWILIATIAAVGNAGVPMGCYFLANALLMSMNVPLKMMGMILPLYAIFDMLETSLNVWSDICVTAIVDQDLKNREKLLATTQQIDEKI